MINIAVEVFVIGIYAVALSACVGYWWESRQKVRLDGQEDVLRLRR